MTILSYEERSKFRETTLNFLDKSLLYLHPDYDHIAVSTDGRIFNTFSKKEYKYGNTSGYKCISVSRDGVRKYKMVHRIVMEACMAYLDYDYYEVNHIDGNKVNNDITNLEWTTRKENLAHYKNLKKSKKTVSMRGKNNPNCRWKFETICEMRELHRLGFTVREIKESYGIDLSTLYDIINYKERINE